MARLCTTILTALFLTVKLTGLHAQISPGKLSAAHAHLEGLSNCTKCHVLGKKETTAKCLECHVEIRDLITAGKGYHASSETSGKQCHECHGEHFGREFRVIVFDESKFDHNLAGFRLEGKHREAACADCHQPGLVRYPVSQKKGGRSYLGLGTGCISCHDDVHQETLPADCKLCHDQHSFRPATRFDHSKTNYPLLGKHKTTACDLCHVNEIRNGKPFQRFAGTEHSNCTSCHVDVHRNKFGSNCVKCHNENSFREVRSMSTFDHNQTGFPLTGMHRFTDCRKCHPDSYTREIRHGACTDCHDDEHNGQLNRNGKAPDCRQCHSTEGFAPSSYSIEDHDLSAFPLAGAHRSTPCTDCHRQGKTWDFSISGNRCVHCHKNIHEGKINEKYFPQEECRVCHNAQSWANITFDHSLTNFALKGKHETTSCRDCHFRQQSGQPEQQFQYPGNRCENCHEDVHSSQFVKNGVNDCERCHAFDNWKAERFNHNDARFRLDGRHSGLDCTKCHKQTDGLIRNYIIYKFKDISCASCHS